MKQTKTIVVTKKMLAVAKTVEMKNPHTEHYCGRCIIGHAVNRAYKYKVGGPRVDVGFETVRIQPTYGKEQRWKLDAVGYDLRKDFDACRYAVIEQQLPVTVTMTRIN